MKSREIIGLLCEGKIRGIPLLYHATEWGPEIVQSGQVNGYVKTGFGSLDNRQIKGLSLTRSRNFAASFGPWVFGFNEAKLRQKYRICPWKDSRIDNNGNPGDQRREAEEFLFGENIPLASYCEAVWISSNLIDVPGQLRDLVNRSGKVGINYLSSWFRSSGMDDLLPVLSYPKFAGVI